MKEGICPKCGSQSYGWALCQVQNQNCRKCGAKLVISFDGKEVFKARVVLGEEKHAVDMPELKD